MDRTNVRAVKPVIISVTGPSGPVTNGGVTPDTALTLSGSSGGATYIEILDGSLSLGVVRVDSDPWRFDLTGLTQTYHIITARSVLDQLVSDPWVFTVQASSTPIAINSIKDAAGNEVLNGGTLYDNSTVIISGTGQANQQVEIFDYTESAGPVNVDINGNWKFQAWGLRSKEYSIKAKGLYESYPESAVRTFNVASVGRENFETRPLTYLPVGTNVYFSDGLIGLFTLGDSNMSSAISENHGNTPGFGQRVLMARTHSQVSFQFSRVITNFKFSHSAVNQPLNSLVFYGVDGGVIETYYMVPNNPIYSAVVVNLRISKPCVRCVFVIHENAAVDTGIYLDNFEWY